MPEIAPQRKVESLGRSDLLPVSLKNALSQSAVMADRNSRSIWEPVRRKPR